MTTQKIPCCKCGNKYRRNGLRSIKTDLYCYKCFQKALTPVPCKADVLKAQNNQRQDYTLKPIKRARKPSKRLKTL